MYPQTPRLSITDGDLDVDRADEDGNGTTNEGAGAYFRMATYPTLYLLRSGSFCAYMIGFNLEQENGPLSSVKSFDTGRVRI